MVTMCAGENKESEGVGQASMKVVNLCEVRHKVNQVLKVKRERIWEELEHPVKPLDLFQMPSELPMW